MMPFGMMYGYGGVWMGLIGLIINLLIVAGVIYLVVWAVRRFSGGSTGSQQSPREILKARYARGEITRDQYQQMLQDLG